MLLQKISDCYSSMDRVSRIILRIGLCGISLMYLTAIVLLAWHGRFFPDYDTAVCCVGTLLDGVKEISGAVIVPVLLYETLGRLILRGRG